MDGKRRSSFLTVIIAAVLCVAMMLPTVCCLAEGAATVPAADEAESVPGKRVYFAAPLFSQSEKDFNLKLTHVLEAHGYTVFLPQRDGFLAVDLEGKTQ